MGQSCLTFATCEDGAVTVDWVTLCVAVVFMVGLVIAMVAPGASDLAQDTSAALAQAQVTLPPGDQSPD